MSFVLYKALSSGRQTSLKTMEIPTANYCRMRMVLVAIVLLFFIHCLPVIHGAAGVERVNRATFMDDEDMATELTNQELQFEVTLSIDMRCADEWFDEEARHTIIKIIRNGLIMYVNDQCSCDFNESGITNEQITCNSNIYHYSAELLNSLETHNTYNPFNVLKHISEWPEEHPKIPVDSTPFGGSSNDNLSFIVEDTEVSSSGFGSGGDGNVGQISETDTSGDDDGNVPPGGSDGGPTDRTIVVVDKQEQGGSYGRRNVMSVFVSGALLTLVLFLVL